MSLEFLRRLSKLHSPLDLTRPADVNSLVVLRAAGMVTAFTLRTPSDDAGPGQEVGRFLALTPDGRQALDGGEAAARRDKECDGRVSGDARHRAPGPPR